ncbi:unannotated protein [freshwater metagenome]|uniref:Unannotated protein n=1 Tax=freshwater metagenome TaxID=449393 RepID=A0A6J7H151_9ZZZZ|nr:glycosyltransferase [Actinomycetota bacterium]
MFDSKKPSLYIDVSHTWNSNLQTGMQKVVRELCAAWDSENFECQLVIFQNGQYKILPRNALKEILIVSLSQDSKTLFRDRLRKTARLIYFKIRSKIPLCIRLSFQTSNPARKIRSYLNSTPTLENYETLNINGINLLILEIVFDPDQIEYIFNLISSKQTSVTFFSYDLIPINYKEFCTPEFIHLFKRYLEISRYSQKLWSISNHTKNELEQFVGNSENLIHSTYKWLPPSVYVKCDHNLPFQNSEKKKYLLFVSSFEPRKNHLGFFLALQLLKKEKITIPTVVFVGGSAWNDGPINKNMENLILEGFDLIKLNNIKECCVGNLYKHALLTLYPSHMEGFGLPVVESLSFGVPVLTSDIGSTAELLKLPGTIGFIPTDPKDLAAKLKLFLTNQSTQQTLTEGAKSAKDLLGNWSDYANDLYLFATKE